MRLLNKILLTSSLSLGLLAQAGTRFDNLPAQSKEVKQVLLDLAKKCQVNPSSLPQEWFNTVLGPGQFGKVNEAVQALMNGNISGYQTAFSKLKCPVNKNGQWLIQ